MPAAVSGPQLPPDSTGKITGSFQMINNTTVWIPAGVITDAAGNAVGTRPYGTLNVSTESNTLFYEPFDTPLDTMIEWNVLTGALATSISNGVLTFNTGSATTAAAHTSLQSRPSFVAEVPSFLQHSHLIAYESGATTTLAHRFWGVGTQPVTPATTSAATKLTDAVGFEIDTDGKMYAVVYAGGVRNVAGDLSSTGTGYAQSKQPTDGFYHRYLVLQRTDQVHWFIDTLDKPVFSASISAGTNTTPNQQQLPLLLHVVNNAASQTAAVQLKCQGISVADTANNGTAIRDGNYAWRAASVDENGNLQVSPDTSGIYQLDFIDPVEGAALNTNLWNGTTATMTVTQGATGILLNAASATATTLHALIYSHKRVALLGGTPTRARFRARVVPATNANVEFGVGTVTAATATASDGCYFRIASASQTCVVNIGGVEVATAALNWVTGQAFAATTYYTWRVTVYEQYARFEVFQPGGSSATLVASATVPIPLTSTGTMGTPRQPLFARVYTTGAAGSAPQLFVGSVAAVTLNVAKNRLWGEQLASARAAGAQQSPVTTFTQTANHANSTGPVSATLSNTAAGYTTLGGRYQFAAPAGAVTDFALFGYQVPAGYQLFVTSILINAMNTGAAVATTATILDWSLGLNSSAVSLATADVLGPPPTAWGPRRVPLGLQGFAVAAAIGAVATPIQMPFTTPLVVDSGRFLHVIVAVPVGTATAAQIIRGDVMINGYFE